MTGASAMGLGSGLTGSLGLLAKSMGAAGASSSMAAGLMYFAEGNTTKGFLDFGTGAAVLAAAATTGPWSVGFVAAAAALTLGSLAYDVAHGDDPASADGARPINGQELFVM